MYVAALAEEAVLRYCLSDQKGRYFGTCTQGTLLPDKKTTVEHSRENETSAYGP
jgi:hypothetical protein